MNPPDPATASERHSTLHLGYPKPHVPGHELFEAEGIARRPAPRQLLVAAVLAAVVALASSWLHHFATGDRPAAAPSVSSYWLLPFVLLLTAIAVMPFIHRHWWEHNYARVAVVLGLIVAVYYVFALGQRDNSGLLLGPRAIAGSVSEYVSFIYLIGALFIVSGGILIRVRSRATPAINSVLLLVGAILANLFGTTGASMLLIRPFLRMNAGHLRPYHVVFFIFIVSNAGGSLTPIGDPPLFLGYLQGVPFWWVFENCWPIWLVVNGGLLASFYVLDRRGDARTPDRSDYAGDDLGPMVSLYGGANLVFIALIIGGILLHEPINHAIERVLHVALPVRELAMVAASIGSLAVTPRRVHVENHFNYAPIKEVGFLFIGIFLTMVPALNYLHHENARPVEERRVTLHTPAQYYFACGSLSAVLDNAPTYLTFLQSKLAQLDGELVSRAVAIAKRPGTELTAADTAGLSEDHAQTLRKTIATLTTYHRERIDAGNLGESETRVGFLLADPRLNLNLVAISMGSVLFGAMTYIGNGPNFMVKSIAEGAGLKMPSFFGYLLGYAVPALLPLLILVWAIFFR